MKWNSPDSVILHPHLNSPDKLVQAQIKQLTVIRRTVLYTPTRNKISLKSCKEMVETVVQRILNSASEADVWSASRVGWRG